MLLLQLLIRRFHPGLPRDVVELIHAFAFLEPEVWQCPHCRERGPMFLIRGRVRYELCNEPASLHEGMLRARPPPPPKKM